MRVITVPEAAELLRVSEDKVYRLAAKPIADGGIPKLRRVGVALRFDADEVEAWRDDADAQARLRTQDGRPYRKRRSERGADWILTPEQIDALPTKGFVYFIQGTSGGLIKIGLAEDVDKRIKAIQANSPVRLCVLWALPGGRRLEYKLHQSFSKERRHGEWFYPSRELVAWIGQAQEIAA